MPLDTSIKKVLVIGSGPIVIGQAAEFDYAGTQACRVLKEAGIDVVLVNSNPATIMTDQAMADEIYLEPLNLDTVKRIIIKEKPDSLLAGLGGQTGLTLAMQLSKDGWLQAHGVRLLGTDAHAIDKAEDRQLFKETMDKLHQPTIPSDIANDLDTALAVAERIGYPVIIRPAFTLGGGGGGVAHNAEEMHVIAQTGLDASPITQILVEKYIFGWKEIEFETMRDRAGNVIAICSMENVDPVGVHTGDSIVVAPALTLANPEYQMLRSASLEIVQELGIVGGCNCQFALNPDSFEYAVIEVNPRVSRSSALASKATGYPIAKVTAKLALGYTLDEIRNDVTGKTCACFEPTVDYVVAKFPKWPFDKFPTASRKLGTQMKATGEVMSIAPSFEMAIMKAVRGAEIGLDTLNAPPLDEAPLEERLARMDDRRLFTIFEALKAGYTVERIHAVTRIDPWFLNKLKKLADFEGRIAGGMDADGYLLGKKLGYTDEALRRISGMAELPAHRDAVYKMVDTCAAEFDAETPYFYSTFDTECESRAFPKTGKPRIIVLGSGPIRIGQGIEFDYSSVHCVWTLQEQGYEVVIINNNPETVSTDYDTADRLYFEPLCPEDVMHVIRAEDPVGVVVAFGGQTAIKLTKFLDESGIPIFGTSAEGIDIAEDRERFDALLEQLHFRRPKGLTALTLEDALRDAESLGYPVLLRPSYVIGGQNMTIAHNADNVRTYMERILRQGIENPVLVDKYMMGTELEVDVISDGEDVLIPGIMEHVERAGVHSGDSIAVYPPYNLNDRMLRTIVETSEKLALSLGTKGLVNIQYLIYEGQLHIIEVNPRASRTVPYISKVTGVPMVDLASRVMIGQKLSGMGYGTGLYQAPPYYAVKVPVFSFEKLSDAHSALSPEMKSTGEVLGLGKTLNEALFKGLTAAGFQMQHPGPGKDVGILISVNRRDQMEIVSLARKFADMGFSLYATDGTAAVISALGVHVEIVASWAGTTGFSSSWRAGRSATSSSPAARSRSISGTSSISTAGRSSCPSPALTSLDTANVLADTLASRFTALNTELVDINHLRAQRQVLCFAKMQGTQDDYIFFDNRDGSILCPESLCVSLLDRHQSIGGNGIVLIEESRWRTRKCAFITGRHGRPSGRQQHPLHGQIPLRQGHCEKRGNDHRDRHGTVPHPGLHPQRLCHFRQRPSGQSAPAAGAGSRDSAGDKVVDRPVTIGGQEYRVTCCNVGNPHCVGVLSQCGSGESEAIGPLFEHAPIFPKRVNTEFVRVVNSGTVKMRVYERGNGETYAAAPAPVPQSSPRRKTASSRRGRDITVKVKGGDLTVLYTEDDVVLTGDAVMVCEGWVEL